jgi:hypothetical protein
LDIFFAARLAKHFDHYVIPLKRPCKVKGFDSKTKNAITHLMILSLVVDGRVMYNLPFLIVGLGKHDVILGRMWLARYRVMVDCHRRRLVWPEDVSLKEEIQAKQFVRLPRKLLLRDREVDISDQEDADRRDEAFRQQEVKDAPAPQLQNHSPLRKVGPGHAEQKIDVPTSYRRRYQKQHQLALGRMRKGFIEAINKAIPEMDNPNPNEAIIEVITTRKTK